jgi:hypothetical protein
MVTPAKAAAGRLIGAMSFCFGSVCCRVAPVAGVTVEDLHLAAISVVAAEVLAAEEQAPAGDTDISFE